MDVVLGPAFWGNLHQAGSSENGESERIRRKMKRRKVTTRPLSLGDLIAAVSSYSKTSEETVATVADLFASGQVRLMNNGRKVRARVR
jgi:hypothetical protein